MLHQHLCNFTFDNIICFNFKASFEVVCRKWIIDNYDPYTDGRCAERMLEGVADYIKRHGVPAKRKLNLWRKYVSVKTFGWVK